MNRDTVAYMRAYYLAHRDEVLVRAASYRDAHREEIRACARAYNARNRTRQAAYAAERRRRLGHEAVAAERAAFYARHVSRPRVVSREYRLAHPEKVKEQMARVRAKRRGAPGSHTYQEWVEKCELFAFCCAYCGERKPLERDHKVPLSRGGSDDISNIVPVCRSCNSRKHTRTTSEFLAVAA